MNRLTILCYVDSCVLRAGLKVLNNALLVYQFLCDETGDSDHSQAPIVQLLGLQGVEFLSAGGLQAQWVKPARGIASDQIQELVVVDDAAVSQLHTLAHVHHRHYDYAIGKCIMPDGSSCRNRTQDHLAHIHP